jgi:hypothetical protein
VISIGATVEAVVEFAPQKAALELYIGSFTSDLSEFSHVRDSPFLARQSWVVRKNINVNNIQLITFTVGAQSNLQTTDLISGPYAAMSSFSYWAGFVII